MIRSISLAAALALLSSVVSAASLDLRFVDASGKAVPDVVVSVRPAAGIPRRPIAFPWPTVMTQQNISFVPHVLIVPVGATVAFPNKDNVRHHIYSFSKAARFELKLYGQDQTRSYTFTSPGAVALGCNIHDRMSGFIRVVDTPYAAKSDAAGLAHLADLPAGAATLTVWHPQLRERDNEILLPQQIGGGEAAPRTISLSLRASK